LECKICGNPAQHRCSICGEYICVEHSSISVICKDHEKAALEPLKSKIIIRDAREEDIETLEKIEDSTIWEHIGLTEEETEEHEKVWDNIKTYKIVASLEEELIGFLEYHIGVDPHEQPAIMVTDVAVLPEYQGYGVGTKLFEELEKRAKEKDIKRIYVSTSCDNIPAIIYHLKRGAKIFSVKELEEKKKGRWGIPRAYDFSFLYEIK